MQSGLRHLFLQSSSNRHEFRGDHGGQTESRSTLATHVEGRWKNTAPERAIRGDSTCFNTTIQAALSRFSGHAPYRLSEGSRRRPRARLFLARSPRREKPPTQVAHGVLAAEYSCEPGKGPSQACGTRSGRLARPDSMAVRDRTSTGRRRAAPRVPARERIRSTTGTSLCIEILKGYEETDLA